jgi:hypothetical protein
MTNPTDSSKEIEIPKEFKIWFIGQSHKELISQAYKEWTRRGQRLCYEVAYTEGYQDASEAAYRHLHPSPSGWIEIKPGCEMPEIDEVALWYLGSTDRYFTAAIDKDDYDWWNGVLHGSDRIERSKCTHWSRIIPPRDK